jgi:hypothetical protein
LAGFIEADGYFGVRVTIGQDITEESFKEMQKELGQNLKRASAEYSRVECRWELSQAQTRKMRKETVQEDDDMGEVMEAIAKYVGSSVERIREERGDSNPQYRVRSGSLVRNERVEAYLEKYQLFSSKYLDYKD